MCCVVHALLVLPFLPLRLDILRLGRGTRVGHLAPLFPPPRPHRQPDRNTNQHTSSRSRRNGDDWDLLCGCSDWFLCGGRVELDLDETAGERVLHQLRGRRVGSRLQVKKHAQGAPGLGLVVCEQETGRDDAACVEADDRSVREKVVLLQLGADALFQPRRVVPLRPRVAAHRLEVVGQPRLVRHVLTKRDHPASRVCLPLRYLPLCHQRTPPRHHQRHGHGELFIRQCRRLRGVSHQNSLGRAGFVSRGRSCRYGCRRYGCRRYGCRRQSRCCGCRPCCRQSRRNRGRPCGGRRCGSR
mmetsp:Transcript_60892/g.132226  ORF Transcript_60892/g.132226 Transcript_60892/m.132226 type:complete len:299 (-) Transcript_60892:341-1237(-)